jgi:hypothetical protein
VQKNGGIPPNPSDFKSLASTSFATPAMAAFCHF